MTGGNVYAEGFWRAPRGLLPRTLEDGELTPTEYGIVHYVAEKGADRDTGYSTTYGHLAAAFGVSEKTVSRAFEKLNGLDLLVGRPGQGQRHPFRVRLGPRLSEVVSEVVSEPVSEVTSEVTSDTTSDADRSTAARHPASGGNEEPGATSDTTSDTSRARAQTETETETETVTVLSRDDALTRASGNGHEHLDEQAREALNALVAELDDADEDTFVVFAAEFSDLTAAAFRTAHATLGLARARGTVRKSEAGFVYGVLMNIAGGYA